MTVIEELRNKKDIKHIENKYQNGRKKLFLISNYILCKWLKLSKKKKQGLAEWFRKHAQSKCSPKEIHFTLKDRNRLKVKGQKEILHIKRAQERPTVYILLSDKIDFKTIITTKDKNIM